MDVFIKIIMNSPKMRKFYFFLHLILHDGRKILPIFYCNLKHGISHSTAITAALN